MLHLAGQVQLLMKHDAHLASCHAHSRPCSVTCADVRPGTHRRGQCTQPCLRRRVCRLRTGAVTAFTYLAQICCWAWMAEQSWQPQNRAHTMFFPATTPLSGTDLFGLQGSCSNSWGCCCWAPRVAASWHMGPASPPAWGCCSHCEGAARAARLRGWGCCLPPPLGSGWRGGCGCGGLHANK